MNCKEIVGKAQFEKARDEVIYILKGNLALDQMKKIMSDTLS